MKNKGITVDIAVDCGRSEVKVVRYDNGRLFKTKFISYLSDDENTTLDEQIKLSREDYRLTVDGEKLFIGAVAGGAGENSRGITHDEKFNEDALKLIYAAIYAGGATSRVVINQIRLAICVPMENVAEEKENFKKLIGTRHVVIDNVTGEEHEFDIVEVEVFGEGLVSAFAIPNYMMRELDNHLVGYLNIGSFKSNIGTFFYRGNKAEYQDKYSGSLNGIGMQEAIKNGTEGSLVKSAMTRLNSKFHWNEKFVDVRDARREKGSKIVLCGGAASALEKDFSEAFSADGRNNKAEVIVHPEGIFSDAVGSINLARMRWQAQAK
jgi:hypothetical protein